MQYGIIVVSTGYMDLSFIGPIVGALAGTALYDLLIFTGPESIFNQPYAGVGQELRHVNGVATKGVPFVSTDGTA
ncbi:hypothetical protein FRC12_012912 [Ceratobasidium sp. 428]|nr:hypothetical protein FRC12_012912 [Ceratobasidium sp. 428]